MKSKNLNSNGIIVKGKSTFIFNSNLDGSFDVDVLNITGDTYNFICSQNDLGANITSFMNAN